MTTDVKRVVVAQLGAREHYMAAAALESAGALANLVTDWYAPQSRVLRALLARCGSVGQRMLAATATGVPISRVHAHRMRALAAHGFDSLLGIRRDVYSMYVSKGQRFAKQVAKKRLCDHEVLFLYSYAALEALEVARNRGKMTVLDQIDPGPAEFRLVQEEAKAWPEYVCGFPTFPEAYYRRLREEWRLADVIIVNSRWSQDLIVSEGVPLAKVRVLPLAIDVSQAETARPAVESRKRIRVLWLGQVNIRKGIQYLVEAARLLHGFPIEFCVVGQRQISAAACAAAPDNISWHDPIPRCQVGPLYQSADVFVLPTVSDGFAITQLESLAYGVPVVTTPNCGAVVEDGKSGFIVPAGDSRALADALLRFVLDRQLTNYMREACILRAKHFSREVYQRRLMAIIREFSTPVASCE